MISEMRLNAAGEAVNSLMMAWEFCFDTLKTMSKTLVKKSKWMLLGYVAILQRMILLQSLKIILSTFQSAIAKIQLRRQFWIFWQTMAH